MAAVETELREFIDAVTPRLLALSETESETPPRPGKWSPKEIIGHLVDSASNNHQRFVRAQFTEDLVCSGYDQEAWVTAQSYRAAPWTDLVGLWRLYNLHLARVMERIPASGRLRPRTRHNLDEIAWRVLPRDRPANLEYLMRDYVGHLKHHVGQILGRAQAERDG